MPNRDLIEPDKGDKRYVRRDRDGQITSDQADVAKSSADDRASTPRPPPRRARATARPNPSGRTRPQSPLGPNVRLRMSRALA